MKRHYAAACKPCNTALKSNFFPIAGSRGPQRDDPLALSAEQPYLPYPIGSADEDPEELIRFDGLVAVPRETDPSGHRWRRARVTIDFFALNIREELQRERSRMILGTYFALRLADTNAEPDRTIARKYLEDAELPSQPHRNCARSFRLLYESDPARAEAIAEAVHRYLKGQS